MTSPTPAGLTPYDTGERCEPKLWQPDRASVLHAMQYEDEGAGIGNVDFEDDCGDTVVTIHVSRTPDGVYTVHVIPFVGEAELEIERHDEPIV
jgi:hypothetical protein